MKNDLMIKRFEDVNVFFMEDGWFNASSVAKKFGKFPADWMRQESTKEYIQELLLELSNTGNPIIEHQLIDIVQVKRGRPENGGGTWLHPELSVEFARWCSPKFARWCDKQIKDILVSNSGIREKVYERQDFPVFQNDALGFTQCMSAEDSYCKAHRVSFDTTIKEFCGLRNPVYIRQLTNLVFKIFTGFEVRDFRRGWGITPGSRLRTRLFVDSNLRRAIDDVEVQVRAVIKEHEIDSFDEIYTLVGDIAQSISGHCRAHRISLGRSVPINLRVVA
jgi:hypothetical protein